ncbi:MAG: hypothetical protein HC812_07165 [Leptolyngbya sp. RL_3_1]|nr:hypothetical protein [Leptolyngbya sp. RL_3_1]
MPATPRKKKHKAPDDLKVALKTAADELIESTLKPKHIQPPPTDHDFNYLVDIYSKWYQSYFYFCSTYNCPGERAISPSFDDKFARMEYVGDGKFNLSYMRHTQKWWEIYQDLTMAECLERIAAGEHFTP